MNNTIRHRGPNDEGYYINGPVSMAMRRLSIIDVACGHQPIHNEKKDVWIVFNGEIFNYLDLRRLLEKAGHFFYTESDTETIVHLYEEFGERCVDHLRGMFAFAIWDDTKRTLFVARDRLGIKPLFYSIINESQLIFASEAKALLECSNVNRQTSLQALDAFFAYGYIPAPMSIYSGIQKLLPGHTLSFSSRGVVIKKYWDLYFRPDYGKSEGEFIDEFDQIFGEAVKMRMMSEVPLGAFLSGGVDSSLMVAYMAKMSGAAIHSFTVGYSESGSGYLDERPYARLLADRYGCIHREIVVEPTIENILDKIAFAFDEPFGDDSAIPSFWICDEAKRDVTVALTGLGGDELFGGYERYLGFHLSSIMDKLPGWLYGRKIIEAVDAIPEFRNGHYFINHLKRFMRAARMPLEYRYQSYVSIVPASMRAKLFNTEIASKIDYDSTLDIMLNYYRASNAEDPLDKAVYQDIKTYLPDDILTLTDRIGMLKSQELRVPFVDHKLVEFCATIPAKLKLRGMNKKYLLKKIARRMVPRKIIRHRKQGFVSPMAYWLKKDLRKISEDLLSKKSVEDGGYLAWPMVERVVREHLDGAQMHDRLIFSMMMFVIWARRQK